jgi:hypothetical protein
MTASVGQALARQTGGQSGQMPERTAARPDREAVDRFRDALHRKGSRSAGPKQDASAPTGDKEPAGSPLIAQAPLPSLPFLDRPVAGHRGKSDRQEEQGALSSATATAPARAEPTAVAAPPLAASTADVGGFAALVARLDTGLPPSALSHLALPGDLWRAEQVVINQQAGGLCVTIDLGSQGEGSQESLAELQARLRARGLNATVSNGDPGSMSRRIADAHSRNA